MVKQSAKISNIKITNGDKILHWWKLNSIYDEGLNDKDFYALWESIGYMFGLIYGQSYQFLNIRDKEDLIRRFLETFGVIVGENTPAEDIIFIFDAWMQELNKRGSVRTIRPKSLNKGMCLNIPEPYVGFTNKGLDIQLGNIYTVSFDWKFSPNYLSNDIDGYLIKGVNSTPLVDTDNYIVQLSLNVDPAFVDVNFYPYTGGEVYSTQLLTDGTLYRIKIVRNIEDVYIYIDDILVHEGQSSLNSNVDIIEQDSLLERASFIRGVTGRIANLSIKTISENILFPLNERSFILFDKLSSYRMDYIYSTLSSPHTIIALNRLFEFDNDFNNLNSYSEVDSEIVRMIGGSSDEFIFPLCDKVDLDWIINSCSPMVTQSYPIINMNKFPTIGNDLNDIAIQYGKADNSAMDCVSLYLIDGNKYAIRVAPQSGLVGDLDYYGISLERFAITGYNYYYSANLYAIPVSHRLDYEISFRIRCENADIETFLFEILAFDSLYQTAGLKSAKTGAAESKFITLSTIATIGKYTGKDLWVRGILYNSKALPGEDMTDLNMNFPSIVARNLIMSEDVKYIYPSILFRNTTVNTDPVYIWDIQMTPLAINTSKGTIGVKNIFLPVMENNSTTANGEIEKSIQKSFIPYDSLVKVNFIEDRILNEIRYGFLYNWWVIDDIRGIVSELSGVEGWGLPNQIDVVTLRDYLVSEYGVNVVLTGNSLKSKYQVNTPLGIPYSSTDHPRWDENVTHYGTDLVGFNAMPNGGRLITFGGASDAVGQVFMVWTSSSLTPGQPILFKLTYNTGTVSIPYTDTEYYGMGIRFMRAATVDELLLDDGAKCTPYIGTDGRLHKSVKIGTQVWMSENLAETKYSNGDDIPIVSDAGEWVAAVTGAMCAYNNNMNYVFK